MLSLHHEELRTLPLEERWNDARFAEFVTLWNLGEDDQANMRTLQHNIRDVDHWTNDPFEVIRFYKEFHQSGARHHASSMKKVEKKYRYMVQWRLDNDVDTWLQRNPTPDPNWQYNLPCKMLETTDHDGDPIFIDRVGAADSWGLLQHFGSDEFVHHMIFLREMHCHPHFWWQLQNRNNGNQPHRVRHFNAIVDLEGLNIGHLRPGLLPLLERVTRVLQDCYAGWEKRIFVIRAPAVFKIIWAIAKHFFDQHIQEALIFGTKADYLDVLAQHMDLENLPPEIAPEHGKAKGFPGYFAQSSLKGGPFQPVDKEVAFLKAKELEALSDTDSASVASESSDDSSSSSVKVRKLLTGTWNPASLSKADGLSIHITTTI